MAELFVLPARTVRAPAGSAHSLPLLRNLAAPQRLEILLSQLSNDVTSLAGSTGAPLKAPDLSKLPNAIGTDIDAYRRAVSAADLALLAALTPLDFRMGKAYSLGRALCAAISPATTTHSWQESRALLASREWVTAVQGWLGDLKSSFAPSATDTVVITLMEWHALARGTSTGSKDANGNGDGAAARLSRLDRQGEIWRSLLSGEKQCPDFLNVGDYTAASRRLVGHYARLAWQFLVGLWPILLVGTALLALTAFVLNMTNQTTAFLALAAAVLGAFGISSATAVAAVKQALVRVEQPLWETEITAAMVGATSLATELSSRSRKDVVDTWWRNSNPQRRGRRWHPARPAAPTVPPPAQPAPTVPPPA
jgi:hypothetical protein